MNVEYINVYCMTKINLYLALQALSNNSRIICTSLGRLIFQIKVTYKIKNQVGTT